MTIEQRIDEDSDQFPAGMRVLAVDDDPTCLLLLEQLLRRCKYHVTTRTHAIAALNLLRENKNRFDLVISDVHMPDMDGFKLLELVGLEMDLPVIMLSANGDPKLVMKGITHGACDYLLKPVRIEELQIIWQHVIRKKTVDPKDQKASENHHNRSYEGGAGNGNNGQKSNKKRKDQVEDEDEDNDENGLENDDPSAQKKPRVVWSVELHRKFVAAVNHLGVDKAVPKKILELMNVEKLTRENVASHLQKYRLYLRRISCVQSQQANMVAAFGNTDPSSYTRINGVGGFNPLSGSPQFQNATFRSFQANEMLRRLSSSASLGIQRLPSTLQANHSQFLGFSGHAADQGATMLRGNSHGHILKGMPMSFDFDQLQDSSNRSVSHLGQMPSKVDDLTVLDTKPTVGSCNNSHVAAPINPLMLKGHPVQAHSMVGIGNQPAATRPDTTSHLPDPTGGNNNWPVAAQSSAVQALSKPYASFSGVRDITAHLDEGSSISGLPLSIADYQYQGAQVIDMGRGEKQPLVNFASAPNDTSNLLPDPVNSSNLPHSASTPYEQIINENAQGISEFNAVEQLCYIGYPSMQHIEVDNSAATREGKSQAYQQPPNSVGSLEDLVSSMMK